MADKNSPSSLFTDRPKENINKIPFSRGDVVQFKSGGPKMTVEYCDKYDCEVVFCGANISKSRVRNYTLQKSESFYQVDD